ncbi:ethylene-responsive transcription factor ERF017-like [Vicia villosa]|uniref:ethylene-responsive transcription factor ERF017-like n=1 Tax=Vicia villosa TaxID=3911 RepID=UPI00273CE29D|nr:ethylene-responsive transcription factor ERF017-like [Vicia villosa]
MDHHRINTDHDQVKGKTSLSSSGNNDDINNKKMYRGVRKRKWGKWVCEIRLPNSRERIWLGSYDSPEKAARAFDAALYCLRGRHASFNFPDSPFHLENTAVSNDPQQIREIAASFGNKNPSIVIDNNNNNTNNDTNNTGPSKTVTEIIGSSSSTTMHDSRNSIDWTFLNVLEDGSSNDATLVGSENYDDLFYSDLEKMHSDELLYYTSPPLFEDNNNQNQLVEDDGNDPFCHQSFLWSWNF